MEFLDGFELTAGWCWVAAGLALVVAELAVPGFVIFFFGLGAILTGALLFVFPGMSQSIQVLVFAASSVAMLATCRRLMPASFRGRSRKADGDPDDDEIAGAAATVAAGGIEAGREGKVEFRGTLWSARAEGGEALAEGTAVRVVRRDNLALVVRKA